MLVNWNSVAYAFVIATESDSDFDAFCAQIRRMQKKKKTMMVDLMKMVAKMTSRRKSILFSTYNFPSNDTDKMAIFHQNHLVILSLLKSLLFSLDSIHFENECVM